MKNNCIDAQGKQGEVLHSDNVFALESIIYGINSVIFFFFSFPAIFFHIHILS